jgi:hypothetical protein
MDLEGYVWPILGHRPLILTHRSASCLSVQRAIYQGAVILTISTVRRLPTIIFQC